MKSPNNGEIETQLAILLPNETFSVAFGLQLIGFLANTVL